MMPLTLYGKDLRALGATSERPFVARINVTGIGANRDSEIFLNRTATAPSVDGFRAYLHCAEPEVQTSQADSYVIAPNLHYLDGGDIVRIDPTRGTIRVLYRRSSPFNSLLVTERCDNYCVMCSQPPKPQDDSWLVEELKQIIPLMSADTRELGITGGEPGLLGSRLIELLTLLRDQLPSTTVHILSNGRAFSDPEFARDIARVKHPDLMIGIPVYSDLPEEHDYVVQARGAFSETIRGILNLKREGVRVEIRFVVHADTYKRLPEFARFVVRNLLFVDHVALMGLELTGFAKANIDVLWIDPLDYQPELVLAAEALDRAGIFVSIYNHQLCVLDERVHRYSRRSISDWKNIYFDECDGCATKPSCGGFFTSSTIRKSRGIQAVRI